MRDSEAIEGSVEPPVQRIPQSFTGRAALHYLWCLAVLSVYGGQVCPYIEGMGITDWLLELGIFFGSMFFIRQTIMNTVVESYPLEHRPEAQFVFELGAFVIATVGITLLNFLTREFPLGSGMKIITGAVTLGFFAATDLSLARERDTMEIVRRTGRGFPHSERYIPLTGKFIILSATSIVLVTLITFLVISKDLSWLSHVAQEDFNRARLAVLGELAFITVVILVGIGTVIISFSRNLRERIESENASLKSVSRGDLDTRVPVSSRDEFGVMAWYTNLMIEDLSRSLQEVQTTQDVTIMTLASLAEIRDTETGEHIIRTQRYVRALAEHLSEKPKYRDTLTPQVIDLMYKSAPLHDIGKVGIPDAILQKPGKLTAEEYEIMKQHPRFGRDALKGAEDRLGTSSFLRVAREIAYTHHEKWDGSGYPDGLRGEDIPLAGRLMALADVYDALAFKRVYREALSHETAREIIVGDSGTHFDPEVVEAFLAIEETFRQIVATSAPASTRASKAPLI